MPPSLPPLLPAPLRARALRGRFTLATDLPLCVPTAPSPRAMTAARVLRDGIEARTGCALSLQSHARLDGLGHHLALILDPSPGQDAPKGLAAQCYRLEVNPRSVLLRAPGEAGLRHGVETLLQLVDDAGRIPCCEIDDRPSLERRGLLLDISRGKVPRASELLRVVELCARLKLNVLMLYTEHTFRFRRHPDIGRDAAPLCAETLLELDAHAFRHGVELVPCLQSLGHMEQVLKWPRYTGLAESELRWSLAPTDPATYDLLADLYDEYLPNFRSELFNANCDEPWDLGRGRSASLAARLGPGGLYLRHLQRVQKLAGARGKRTMIWGDVLQTHPELCARLDRKLVVLDWWYEASCDYDRVRALADHGLSFWVCPGTASWNSLFPRVPDSVTNISGWADAGRRHGAQGLLVTDWGDFGHYNLLGNSYFGYAWAAQQAWSGEVSVAHFDRAFARQFFDTTEPTFTRVYRTLGALHDVGYTIANGSPLSFLFFDSLRSATFIRHADARVLRRTLRRLRLLREHFANLGTLRGEPEQTRRELAYALDASAFALEKGLAGLEYHDWLADPKRLRAVGRDALADTLTGLARKQRRLLRQLFDLWSARSHEDGFEYTERRLSVSVRSLRAAAAQLRRNAPAAAPPLAPLTLTQAVGEMRAAMGPL